MPIPDNPQTRQEMYLDAMATGDSSGIPDTPQTREEMYLDAIAKNGSGGGGGGVGGGVIEGVYSSADNAITLSLTAAQLWSLCLTGSVSVHFTIVEGDDSDEFVSFVNMNRKSTYVGETTYNFGIQDFYAEGLSASDVVVLEGGK